MTTYIFNEPGCIPGVPGTFAGVRVTVAEDGTLDVQPLAQHLAFEAASEEETPSPIVQEQVPSDLALNLNQQGG